jgi:hypothetical protein
MNIEEAVRAREAWIAMQIQEWLLTGEKPDLEFLPEVEEALLVVN